MEYGERRKITMNRPIILTDFENNAKLVVFSDDISYILSKYDPTIPMSPHTEICIIKDTIVKIFRVNEDVEEILERIYK